MLEFDIPLEKAKRSLGYKAREIIRICSEACKETLGLEIIDAIRECEKEQKFQFSKDEWRNFEFDLNNKQIYSVFSHFIVINEYWMCKDIIIWATKHWKRIMKKKKEREDQRGQT